MSQQKAGIIIATVAAVLMTVTQALGTGIVSFSPRLLYWFIVMETGAAIGIGVSWSVQSWGRLHAWRWAELLLISLLIAVPLTLAVLGASMIILGMERPGMVVIGQNFMLVVFISFLITALTYAIGRRSDARPPLETPPRVEEGASGEARFRDRLPIALQAAPILALESEDHYLRVHTGSGSTLILMRLSDAMAELEGSGGLQIHRGWWVAREAVVKAVKGDGKAKLILSNGSEAPVSRSYLPALREQGWL